MQQFNTLKQYVFRCLLAGCRKAANCRTAGIKFTQAKNQVFRPCGATLAPIPVKLAGPTGTWVRLAVQNFTSIATGGGECETPLTDFENF